MSTWVDDKRIRKYSVKLPSQNISLKKPSNKIHNIEYALFQCLYQRQITSSHHFYQGTFAPLQLTQSKHSLNDLIDHFWCRIKIDFIVIFRANKYKGNVDCDVYARVIDKCLCMPPVWTFWNSGSQYFFSVITMHSFTEGNNM